MNMGRHDYDFRARDFTSVTRLSPTPNADTPASCRPDGGWEIVAPESGSRLMRYYTYDLCRFLADAFGVYIRVRRTGDIAAELDSPSKKIILACEDDTGAGIIQSNMKAAYRITAAEDHITVIGKTERGTAQGVYYIEECLRMRGDGMMAAEDAEHAPLFSPRMTHSGVELDTFPDGFLEAAAHAGMDAVIVYAGHPDMSLHGFTDPDGLWPGSGRAYCDYADLVRRAEGYGLDVYVYSHIKCDVHPDDPGAAEYYDASFGKMFRDCPGIKGIIFVGETFEFPSRDEHTSGIRIQLKPKGETRPSPGWYPCSDYPDLVNMVKNTIRRYSPEADIVFWTYNWGYVGREERLRLIENLPRDISLLVTFDMWEIFTDENGADYRIDDYSISFPGPSKVFVSEAEKAHELGIRLYTMCNTGGRTWDNGASPYLPVPQQWQKRYEGLRRSHELYGLAGLMEDHHYGWLPSFLSQFSRNAFMTNAVPDDEMLKMIARRDWKEKAGDAIEAWRLFSEGISKVVASNVDQYGPYRCGPTYPLLLCQTKDDIKLPSVPWAMHGGDAIWNPFYPDGVFGDPKRSLLRLRHVREVEKLFREGLTLLEKAAADLGAGCGGEISRQTANAGFICRTYITARHVMEWNIAKRLLLALKAGETHDCDGDLYAAIGVEPYSMDALAGFMRRTAADETENTNAAVEYWRQDSSIGFEASMEYVFNDEMAAWKNAETKRSLEMLDRLVNETDTDPASQI